MSAPRWFEVAGLRVRIASPARYLTLVDALQAREELQAAIEELQRKLDVRGNVFGSAVRARMGEGEE